MEFNWHEYNIFQGWGEATDLYDKKLRKRCNKMSGNTSRGKYKSMGKCGVVRGVVVRKLPYSVTSLSVEAYSIQHRADILNDVVCHQLVNLNKLCLFSCSLELIDNST